MNRDMFVADSPLNRIPGHSFTLSKRPAAYPSDVWAQADWGRGPYLYTKDKRAYLDLVCALGALTVGADHPHVQRAVERQLRAGAIFSLPHWLEADVAARLHRVIPCAEQVKVVKTGSEACAAAVRIARAATGRQVVALMPEHYHGWSAELIVAKPVHPGVPDFMEQGIVRCNDIDALMRTARFKQDLAAVIVEPERIEYEYAGALGELRRECTTRDAVLIFDEMLSGGRLAVGGAQELYKVTPDLACFGKALGGGLPFAFVCGSRDLMQHAWPASGTYSGDVLALAACDAMLDLYRDEDIIGKLWAIGTALFQSAAYVGHARPELGLRVCGNYPRFWFTFGPNVDRRVAMSVFVQECAVRGVLVHQAVVFANAAMEHGHVMHAVGAFTEAMTVVADGIRDGNLASKVRGACYEDSVR